MNKKWYMKINDLSYEAIKTIITNRRGDKYTINYTIEQIKNRI